MTDHCLFDRPQGEPRATLLLAHGAGAPMDSYFMSQMAGLLCDGGMAVVRFEFPYMARRRTGGGRRPPDRQPVLLDCWRQQVTRRRRKLTGPLWIGGKSLGGRMASLVADELAVDGLICLGYPFHPPGKPERTRTEHLAELATPTLIVQGSRDKLGNREEVADYALSSKIQLHWLEDGDHDFKPRVKSGYRHPQHMASAAEAVLAFASPAGVNA